MGVQEGLDTSGYQLSADLGDVKFYWEKDQPDVDAVFKRGVHTPFSPTAFDGLEMKNSAQKPDSAGRRGRQRELSSNNNNTSL